MHEPPSEVELTVGAEETPPAPVAAPVAALVAVPPPVPRPPWMHAAGEPRHPLAALERRPVGDDVRLSVWLGPVGRAGGRGFRLFLDAGHAVSVEPVAAGWHHAGAEPAWHWAAVTDFRPALPMSDGRNVEVPAGIELRLFEALATLVPPGGALAAEYDSPARDLTARALAARIPPRATPLGALLDRVGCGTALRDRYGRRGGAGGARSLVGTRALDAAHATRAARATEQALRRYLDDPEDRDWSVEAVCRPIAQAALDALPTGATTEAPRGD